MNSENREHISALMDDELNERDTHAIIDKMHADPQMLKQWERYHLVSNALKKNLPDTVNSNLTAAIQKNIEDIPFQPLEFKRPARASTYGKTAGYALAASLGAVAFLGIINSEQQLQIPALTQNNSSLVQPVSAIVKREPAVTVPVPSAPSIEPVQVRSGRWNVEHPSVESKLNDYLANHEYSAAAMPRGIPPYVRIVGYEPANIENRP